MRLLSDEKADTEKVIEIQVKELVKKQKTSRFKLEVLGQTFLLYKLTRIIIDFSED
jgi:hypothetical protein